MWIYCCLKLKRKNTSLPTLHSSNFSRDVPKETLSQEKYATNIPPSVQCTSFTIGRTYTVAEYGNVLQRKKRSTVSLSDVKFKVWKWPITKRKPWLQRLRLDFVLKEMDIIYPSILGIPGKIKVSSSFPLETRHWWNDLPVDIRMANSLLPFKSLHKTYIKIKELLFHHPCLFSLMPLIWSLAVCTGVLWIPV